MILLINIYIYVISHEIEYPMISQLCYHLCYLKIRKSNNLLILTKKHGQASAKPTNQREFTFSIRSSSVGIQQVG